MANRFAVNFNAKIKPERPLNDEFLLCKCYVMALDKNRNRSFISKEAADEARETLYNIPVIGHLYVDDDGVYHMGGHDIEIAKTEDGKWRFKQLTVPYGVVPQQDNVHYEEIEEQDGTKSTYMVADIILWVGRYPELKEAVYDENGTMFNQSMEISVNESAPLEDDKEYTNILSYTYSALCLLGKSADAEYHVEPCFPSARVDVYDYALDDEFTNMMAQLKAELAFCFGADDVSSQEDTSEPKEHSEDVSTDEDEQHGSEGDEPELEPEHEDDDDGSGEHVTHGAEFQSTYLEKRSILENILPHLTVYDGDEVVKNVDYWLCDFDDAFIYVERYEWNRGGDHEEAKGRFAYSFNEDQKEAMLSGDFEEMYIRWLTREELDRIEEERKRYEELVEYKNSREKKDREAEFDAAIDEFNDLTDIAEFAEVIKNRYSYCTVDELKDKCYMIRGKFGSRVAKPKQAEPEVSIGAAQAPVSLRDRLHERYGSK